MRTTIPLLMLAVLPVVAAAGVYKWVDADGNVHFSDTPQPGAEEVHVPPPQTYTPAPLPAITPPPEPPPTPADYSRFELTAPAPDANLWDNTGALAVGFAVEPPLKTARGHKLEILVDGAVRATVADTAATLQNLERGTHSLQGRIVDGAGKPLISTSPVTVHLHRQSVLLPNRARPKPP